MKEQATEKLALIPQDSNKYLLLLTNLIAQSLYRLIEKDVFIKCRERDLSLVQVNLTMIILSKTKLYFLICKLYLHEFNIRSATKLFFFII